MNVTQSEGPVSAKLLGREDSYPVSSSAPDKLYASVNFEFDDPPIGTESRCCDYRRLKSVPARMSVLLGPCA
jgi:hypothetical protein